MSLAHPRKWIWAGLSAALFLTLIQTGLALEIETRAIRLYQRVGSPVARQAASCRFRPTCSHYALHALESEGFWGGNAKIALRMAHCSPLGWAWDALQEEAEGDGSRRVAESAQGR